MSFVSWPFVILFTVVLAARLTVGRSKVEPAYIGILIVAGAVFYAWHVPSYLLILLGSTSVDYVASWWMGRLRPEERGQRKALLLVSIGTNLGLLGLFKYGDLAIRTAARFLSAAHVDVQPPELGLVLPIGISFYTFEAMSYTIDVYRGELKPIASFPRFFLFISFFPHLIAGPIVRAHQFLPQIARRRRMRWPVVCEGLWLITSGFFLKMVCADNIARYVDRVWHEGYSGTVDATTTAWLAVMFSGQIFADFAGYSNIGRGTAYLLGFRLPVNFNAPYLAGSFKNFWERWHITLSQWLRDYLYRPLGGNRKGRRRTLINLLLVMLIGGFWHGAAWRFVAWGGVHGAALAIERSLGLHRPERRASPFVSVLWFFVVQLVVLLAWVLFRSDSLTLGWRFLGNLAAFDWQAPSRLVVTGSLFLVPLVGHHAWVWFEERGHIRLGPIGRAVVTGAMLFLIATLSAPSGAFIYFQF